MRNTTVGKFKSEIVKAVKKPLMHYKTGILYNICCYHYYIPEETQTPKDAFNTSLVVLSEVSQALIQLEGKRIK